MNFPDNRNFAQPQADYGQQPQNPAYDTGDDVQDFRGTLLDPYWGNQTYTRQQYAGDNMNQRSRMWMIAGGLGVCALIVAGILAFSGSSANEEVPTITADAEPYKMKPANPGGIEIPFQDKLVFNRLNQDGDAVQAERLLPPAEQPMVLALQPEAREKSDPVPPVPMATEKLAMQTQKAMKQQQQQVAEVTPQKLAAMAPTEGAVPPPVNDNAAPMMMPEAVPDAPPPIATTKVVSEVPVTAPKAVEAPKVETKKAAAVAGGTRVQLASLPEKAAGDRALAKLQSQWGSTGVSLSLVKAEIPGKGTYWRVQSQPLDKAKAQSICNSVKATGSPCIFAK